MESPLEEKRLKENNFRGFINLIIIALILSHVRLMWENYVKYGLLLTPQNLIKFVSQNDNLIFLPSSIFIMTNAIVLTFLFEKMASKYKTTSGLIVVLHTLNLTFLLGAPLLFHKRNLINPSKLFFRIF
jgi:diacylglycerol O-acyltransferase-1